MVKKEKASTVATSNHTLNYDLPLWTGEDLTSWMGNLNDAMNKIDDGIHDAAMLAQGVQNIGDNLKDLLEKTEQDNIRITASLEALQNTANELQTGLAGVREGLTAANTAIGGISTEQTSLMTQMDAMQDDIGKLMDIVSGSFIANIGLQIANGILLNSALLAGNSLRFGFSISEGIAYGRYTAKLPEVITNEIKKRYSDGFSLYAGDHTYVNSGIGVFFNWWGDNIAVEVSNIPEGFKGPTAIFATGVIYGGAN